MLYSFSGARPVDHLKPYTVQSLTRLQSNIETPKEQARAPTKVKCRRRTCDLRQTESACGLVHWYSVVLLRYLTIEPRSARRHFVPQNIIVMTAFFDPGVARSGGRATAVGAARRDQSNGQRGAFSLLRNSSQQIQIHSRTGDLHSPMKHQQQQDSMASCSARKRTARRSGKLVKRIVAHASLCLDGLDVLAHFLPGKVGRGTLAIPEGHAGIPVVDHRLGLAELAIPARERRGSGIVSELSERGCKNRARLCEGATQGPVQCSDWRWRCWPGGRLTPSC